MSRPNTAGQGSHKIVAPIRRAQKGRQTFKREPLTKQEMNDIANACRTGIEKVIIWTLLDTGLRVSEFQSLHTESFDWQSHKISVIGKGNKPRKVLLTDRIRSLLENYISVNECIGLSVRTIQRVVKRVAVRAKIRKPVSCHVLRHAFAVALLEKGVDLAAVQKILGHENLATTAIYLNLSNEEALRQMREKW